MSWPAAGDCVELIELRDEMVAEYHTYYGSAALMLVNAAHKQVAKKSF